MILSSISISTEKQAASTANGKESIYAPLLGMLVLTVYAGQKTEREIRKLKRKATLNFVQHKVKNFISRLLPNHKNRYAR